LIDATLLPYRAGQEASISLDLFNTPTFFINGRKVVGDVPYEHLKKVIEEELKNAKR